MIFIRWIWIRFTLLGRDKWISERFHPKFNVCQCRQTIYLQTSTSASMVIAFIIFVVSSLLIEIFFANIQYNRISGNAASNKNIHGTVSEQLKKNFAKSRWKVGYSIWIWILFVWDVVYRWMNESIFDEKGIVFSSDNEVLQNNILYCTVFSLYHTSVTYTTLNAKLSFNHSWLS